jgi:thioester reductase-like protein/acyl carrier protein
MMEELVANEPDIEAILPMSSLQRGLLFHHLAERGATAYFGQIEADLTGPVDVEVFKKAWSWVVSRHQALRTSFVWEGVREPLQVIHNEIPEGVFIHKGQHSLETRIGDLDIDLIRPPLWRLNVVIDSPVKARIIWNSHHALLDGWSFQIVVRDLLEAYASFIVGLAPQREPAVSVVDYHRWRRRQTGIDPRAIWTMRLSDFGTPNRFVFEKTAKGPAAGSGCVIERLHIDQEGATDLVARARAMRTTLGSVAHAAWALVLSRTCDTDDVVFGSVVSGRTPEFESLVGLLMNTVPIRLSCSDDETVKSLVDGTHRYLAESRPIEGTPLTDIYRCSGVRTAESLFPSILAFQNYPSAPVSGGGLTLEETSLQQETNYPAAIAVVPEPGGISLGISYRRDRLDADSVRFLLRGFSQALSFVAGDTRAPLSEFELNLPPITKFEDEHGVPTHIERGARVLGSCRHELPPGGVGELWFPPKAEADCLRGSGILVRAKGETVSTVGRMKDFARIDGHLVDLREVGDWLVGHGLCRDAAALARPDEADRDLLVVYYIPQIPPVPQPLIWEALEQHPSLKTPDLLCAVEDILRDADGDNDPAALPWPVEDQDRFRSDEPMSPIETILADLWATTLQIESVGVNDNFFELGGDSVTGIRLIGRVDEIFGTQLDVSVLFDDPTIGGISKALRRSPANSRDPHLGRPSKSEMRSQLRLDESIRPSSGISKWVTPRRPFVTGAETWLGQFTVASLLRSGAECVTYLSPFVGSGPSALEQRLLEIGAWQESFAGRLCPLHGGLTRPNLGLGDDDEFTKVSESIDAIYHLGGAADVPFLPYRAMADLNVESTRQILRLAAIGTPKPCHVLSTLYTVIGSNRRIVREQRTSRPPLLLGDFVRTKWMAEQLTFEAASRGLPVRVYRVGEVWSDANGMCDPTSYLTRLLVSSVAMGVAPNVTFPTMINSADYIADSLVAISKMELDSASVVHLVCPQLRRLRPIPVGRLLQEAGYPVRSVSHRAWRKRLDQASTEDADAVLLPLRFRNSGAMAICGGMRDVALWISKLGASPVVECNVVSDALDDHSVDDPLSAVAIRRSLGQLTENGLIRPAATPLDCDGPMAIAGTERE